MQAVADAMLDLERNLTDVVFDQMKDLVKQVEVRAPVEFSNLRRSGHATVTERGAVVRDQPPEQDRLNDAELKALSKLRGGHPYGRRGRR